MSQQPRLSRRAIAMVASGAMIAALALATVPGILSASADTTTKTFAYSSSTQTFTVPAGITQLNVTMLGGAGGLGGSDATAPIPGGYRGSVSGTLAVTPGEVITIGVGKGGGEGTSNQGSAPGGAGGTNPIGGYAGGTGGAAGNKGSSGGGGGGGAATVIKAGTATIVAAGGGGGGGSGQYLPTAGQPGAATFKARTDTVSTSGQAGITTTTVCTPTINCDGGASAGGGGGSVGGQQGAIAYGAGSSTEYYGFGGYPGANDVGGLLSGTAVYQYYPADDEDGSVTISYNTSAPDAPTAVSGTADESAVDLTWLAPLNTGGAAISDYTIQYAVASSSSWQTFTHVASSDTSAEVTGLVDGTAYQFRVAAVNSFGTSVYSGASSNITPSAVPGIPSITSVTPSDGALSVSFTAATSTAPIIRYEYRLNDGDWIATGTSSPFSVTGLSNGTSYSVELRAINPVGSGAASAPQSATPIATPSAPSITSITPGIGTASVAFTPGNAGGTPVSDYDYQLNGGSWVSVGSTSSPFSITGLGNGTDYSIILRAESSVGDGADSASSSFATPSAPGAPTIGSVDAGDGRLGVNFVAGTTGGLPVTGYQYQLAAGGDWTTVSGSSSPLVITGLTNGDSENVRIRAVNAIDAGAASNTVTATPVTTPGAAALTAGSVAGSDQELDAEFTPPVSDGGSAITGYEYSTDGGTTWRTRATGTTESPLVITTLSSDGTTTLTNGTVYGVEVRAVNAVGAGTASGVAQGIARTVPDAPVLSSVTSLPSSLRVDFAAASNGGSPITGYQYRLDSGAWTDTGSLSTEFVIDGLTDGTAYAVQVRALNAVGAGESPASATLSGTPASAPGAATITQVVSSDRTLTVSVSLGSTGGSAVTAWQYTTDGGATWSNASGTSSPLTISTLSLDGSTWLGNGVSYPIAVRAVNAVGTGPSSATRSVAPMTTAAAPTVTLTPQNGAIQVAYSAGSLGGSSVTDVQYRLGDGDWVSAGSLNSPFLIGSLDNGTGYAVQVRIVNGMGAGAASASASVTPRTVPDAPSGVAASPDGGQTTVSWSAPANDGGSAITGYVATAWSAASGGTAAGTCSTSDLSCTITGLTNGTTYYVSVVAANVAGSGAASSPRVAVTPLAKPSAPAITGIVPSNTFLTVNYTAPASQGSSAITGYQYSLNSGAWVSVGSTNPLVISSLTNGTSYSVVLRAVNSSGAGASSNAMTATPFGLPDVPDPTKIVATPGNGTATVTWTAPKSNGSAITGYDVVLWSAATQGTQVKTCPSASPACSLSGLSASFSGLSNGTTYYVDVDAINAAGTTIRSAPRVAVTPGAPGAVTGLSGNPGSGSVALSWTAGSAGNSAITGYTVWYAPSGSSSYTQFGGTVTSRSATVTGLTNGTAYTFIVYAVNTVGTGQASAVSAAYTPVGVGTVPTFGTPVPTVDGYTVAIVDPDGSTQYSVSSDHGTAAIVGGTITVTGLDAGESATVTVTATRTGSTTVQGTVSGSALLAGTAPQLGDPVRTADGYTVEILNPADGVTYTASASNGASAIVSGSTVTVSGLDPSASATVTVTATRAGYADASANTSGTALDAGTAPTFSDPTRTATGFSFDIENYDSTAQYAIASTNPDATFSEDGKTVLVSGLTPDEAAAVRVTVTASGSAAASATVSSRALVAGIPPTLSAPVQTADGYTLTLVDPDDSTQYSVSSDHGTATIVGGTVTVTGLDAGESATVTVTAALAGSTTAQATASASALLTGTAPDLGTPVRTADGYTVEITNPADGVTYTASASNGASATVTGSTVTVSGLAPSGMSTVTVVAHSTGYTATQTTVQGEALDAGVAPTFSDPTRTATGYTFEIANYDATATYSATTTNPDATVTRFGKVVVVTGLTPEESATVTVQVVAPGAVAISSPITAVALRTGVAPQLSSPVSTNDGYTVTILNPSSDYAYSYSVTDGAYSVSGSTITVSGLAPSQVSTLEVDAQRAGYTDTSATEDGAALGAGADLTASTVVRTPNGFSFTLPGFDAGYRYTATTSAGIVTIVGNTVTVTGLGLGELATVHLTATEAGERDRAADVVGTAIARGTAPVLGAPTSTGDGFTTTIANYSAGVGYTVTVSAGTVKRVGATVTVSGLAAGASATVTVTAAQAGFTNVSASKSGTALAAPATSTQGGRGGQKAPVPPKSTTEVKPGSGEVVNADGTVTPATITTSGSQIGVTSGGVSLRVGPGRSGQGGGITSNHLLIHAKDRLSVSVLGFMSGTPVGLWVFSDRVKVAEPMVGADHTASSKFQLPAEIAPGNHTLVATGTAASGATVTLKIGFTVAAKSASHSSSIGGTPDHQGSGGAALLWWITVPVVILVALFFFLAWRRRRRDDEEDGSDALGV